MNILRKLRPSGIKLLLIAGLIFFIFLNYQWLDISMLSLYSVDDFVFHRVLRKMYAAIISADVQSLFKYTFYNYGFTYFLLIEIICFPFLAIGNTEIVIFLPRMVSAVSALVSVYYIYRIARLYLPEKTSLLFVVLIMSMPAFWRSGMRFHPDWMMYAFLFIALYNLAKDQHLFGKYYNKAVIFLGIAVGIKFQALLFLPLLLAYVFYSELVTFDFSSFTLSLKRAFKSLLIIFAVFLLSNPYLLHPRGLEAFIATVVITMESNRTNHFTYIDVGIGDKIRMLGSSYFNVIFLAGMLLLNIYILIKTIIAREKKFFIITAFCSCILLPYMLADVNKLWPHYYLGTSMILSLIMIPVLSGLKKPWGLTLILIMCLVQVFYYSGKYRDYFSKGKDIYGENIKLLQADANLSLIKKTLEPLLKKEDHILISREIPFDYKNSALPFEHVHFLKGYLNEMWLDSAAFIEKNALSGLSEFIEYDFLVLAKFSSRRFAEGSPPEKEKKYAEEVLDQLKNGAYGYVPIAENENIFIFKKMND